MGNEVHTQWQTLKDKVESDVRSYKQSLKVKIAEIRREVLARNPAPLSMSNNLQAEQLQQMKEQTEISRRAQEAVEQERLERLSETRREDGAKKSSAISRAEAKCEAIKADVEELNEKILKFDQGFEHKTNLVISRTLRGYFFIALK